MLHATDDLFGIVLAGEALHHLRSSLDHAIWAAALRNTSSPADRIQFPIYEKKAAYSIGIMLMKLFYAKKAMKLAAFN
jgi:hypothetical protein